MKKTLIITLEYPPHVGGIASYVDQFASSLPSNKVVLLAPQQPNAKQWDEQKQFKTFRRKLYFPPFMWPRWIKLFFQAWRIVKKESIEQIHVHHVLPVGYVAFLLKKMKKVTYLIFSHGTDIAAAGSKKWKRKMALMVSSEAEQIIVNSENLKLRLVNVFPELAEMTSVLYPCPDKNFFTPPSSDVIEKMKHMYGLEGKQVLLTVSRLVDGKGFPHLIRLMPEILKQVPHLVWIVIGDGPKREYVFKEIQKNNLQNIVRFLGEVPHEELKNYYHLADLFVLLTHPDEGREEGLGLVFLEAAAAGLPVVAGRSGGVEEAVLNLQTGLVIDVHQQPQAIVNAIVDVLKNPTYAKQFGDAGRDRMMREFVWENQVKRVEEWL